MRSLLVRGKAAVRGPLAGLEKRQISLERVAASAAADAEAAMLLSSGWFAEQGVFVNEADVAERRRWSKKTSGAVA